jgi:CBS domain-containing protein
MPTTLRDILRSKGSEVYSISPDATLKEVVAQLIEHNCGSLLVQDPNGDPSIIGIITERDILRASAANQKSFDEIRVADVMSADVITGSSKACISSVMGLLTENRIRHLPVVEDNELKGMISIGDVVKAQYDELAMENHYLKNYIHS